MKLVQILLLLVQEIYVNDESDSLEASDISSDVKNLIKKAFDNKATIQQTRVLSV
jgi:hypothetical protein